MKIVIESVEHAKQRYPTVGDWFYKSDVVHGKRLCIRVSKELEHDEKCLVAIHELVECILCRRDGVTQAQVDQWDRDHPDEEPGDNPNAPYHRQHMFATEIERTIAKELGVDWLLYEEHIDELFV